jgi:uncharacterized protein (TIGR02246 family)
MTDDERAIRALVETWMAASKAGDTQTVLSLMDDDAVFMVPGAEPFGKDVFRQMAGQMAGVTFDGKSDIHEIQVLGDWAYLRNHIDLTVTTPDGKIMKRAGYTLTILRKKPDGRWVLLRDANLLTEQKS